MKSNNVKLICTILGVSIVLGVSIFAFGSLNDGKVGTDVGVSNVSEVASEAVDGLDVAVPQPTPSDASANTPTPASNTQSQVIIDKPVVATSSKEVPSAKELNIDLATRGLESAPLTVDFDIEGKYLETIAVDKESSSKYPSYIIEYITDAKNPWFIYVNNGSYYASPMFKVNNASGLPIIVSETDYITAYDGNTNTFNTTVPNAKDLIVKKVDKIDTKTLNSLTLEVLEKL